jgi:alkylated DNA repair dioxygenase AlkB
MSLKMKTDYLPSEESGAEQLPIVDADLWLYQQVELGQSYWELLSELIDNTEWRQEEITIYGRTHLQPRLGAWYGETGTKYSYSGITLEPQPWSQTLLNLKTRIESLVGQEFNSVLLNYYRDHRDSMGMHSDDEPELGKQPVIASFSLGEQRTLLLRHKYRKDLNTIKLPLTSGSLLVMKGSTQSYWKHGINKLKQPCGPRVNLTFRRIINYQ